MITGMINPSFAWACVAALNCLQNSMMLTPCCPSAGPMGGAGLALPAGIWSFTCPVTFFIAHSPVVPAGGSRSGSALPRLSRARSGPGLLHLHEIQLHRGGPAEDGDQH